jgi:hypothetical protein
VAAVSAAALVVLVPAFVPAGWSVRWCVRVGDCWAAPGARFAVEPGMTDFAVRVEAAAPAIWLQATARFTVEVMPQGTTKVALPAHAISRAFAPRPQQRT